MAANNKIKVCLDTNIIRGYAVRKNERCIHLLESLKDKKIKVVASFYCLMELSDTKKDDLFFYKCFVKQKKTITDFISERKSKNLSSEELEENSEFIQETIEKLKYIEWLDLEENATDLLLEVSRLTNISAPDSIHLTTAFLAGCSHLITEDTHLIKYANKLLKVVSEEEKIEIKLKVLGVEPSIKEIIS